MAAERTGSRWSTFLWGTLILTVGLVFWLDRLGRVDARDWIVWWPVALLVVGLAHLPQRRWLAACAWIAAGAYLLLRKLGYSWFGLGEVLALWPLLFTLAGLTLVVQSLRRHGPASWFRASAVMAGNHVNVGSQEFGGGQAIAVMGGVEIDLASARNTSGETTIDVLAFWGGIDIRVPRGWDVVNRVLPVLGGVEDKTSAPAPGAPRLIVRGAVIMGGIEVKHYAEERRTTRPLAHEGQAPERKALERKE